MELARAATLRYIHGGGGGRKGGSAWPPFSPVSPPALRGPRMVPPPPRPSLRSFLGSLGFLFPPLYSPLQGRERGEQRLYTCEGPLERGPAVPARPATTTAL